MIFCEKVISCSIFSFLFFCTYGCTGSSDNSISLSNQSCKGRNDSILNMIVYESVDKMPEFLGGPDSLAEFISDGLAAVNDQTEVQGKVCVSFVITENGNLLDKRVCNKAVEEYTRLDKACIRLLARMEDKWIPGECDGKKVAVRYTIPVYVKGR